MDAAALSILAGALNRTLSERYAISAILLPVPRRVLVRLQETSASSGSSDDLDLIISLNPSNPTIWIESFHNHPNPDPLAETLTGWSIGRMIHSIAAVPWDRTLEIRLSPQPSEEGAAGILRCELFGSTPRLVLLNDDGAVQYRFPGGPDSKSRRRNRDSVSRPRNLDSESGRGDLGPATPAPDTDRIRFLDSEALETASGSVLEALETTPPFKKSDKEFLADYLTYTLRGCGEPLAREILHRSQEKEIPVKQILLEFIEEFEKAKESDAPNLHLYLPDESRRGEPSPGDPMGILSAFELLHLAKDKGLRHREDELFAQAERWGRHLQKREAYKLLRRQRDQMIRTLQNSLTKLAKKLIGENKKGERAGTWREWAQALLVHKQLIQRGSRSAAIPDPMDPDRNLEIPLSPTRTVPENAEDYFRKAGREDRARPLREKRLTCVESVVTHLAMAEGVQGSRSWKRWIEQGDKLFPAAESKPPVTADLRVKWRKLRSQLLPLLEPPGSPEPLEDFFYRLLPASAEGRAPGAREIGRPAQAKPKLKPGVAKRPVSSGFHPRRFVLDEGWVVLVGRSNQENDHLTHHLARSDDLWFHAGNAAGSHVVLRRAGRKDNPSVRSMEEAASIAARYSKAHHSAKVPVTYTLKKFVRKPRKAPAGLALCTQTKTIMIPPASDDWLKAHQAATGGASSANGS